MKVTCPKCGSDQITHGAHYIVRNLVTVWNGKGRPVEFGDDEIISDSCDTLEYPFDCKGCGEVELDETELIYDGKRHPGWVDDDVDG